MATVRVTPEMAEQAIRETDRARLDAQTDDEIARNVAGDPDAVPVLMDAQRAAALVRTVRLQFGLSQVESRGGFISRSAHCGTGNRTGASRTRRR